MKSSKLLDEMAEKTRSEALQIETARQEARRLIVSRKTKSTGLAKRTSATALKKQSARLLRRESMG